MSTPSGLPLPADRRCAPVLELITDDCAASSEARASARTCRVVGRLEGLRRLQSAARPAEKTHKLRATGERRWRERCRSVAAHLWSRRPLAIHAVVHLMLALWPPASGQGPVRVSAREWSRRARLRPLRRAFLQLSSRSDRPGAVGFASMGLALARSRIASRSAAVAQFGGLLCEPSYCSW